MNARLLKMKYTEENMAKHDIHFRNIFANACLAARKTKEKINKYDYTKVKSFLYKNPNKSHQKNGAKTCILYI